MCIRSICAGRVRSRTWYVRRGEKLPFLPRPGVGIRATSEFVAHWLEGDVRYTLICQGITSSDDLRELTRSLAKVG